MPRSDITIERRFDVTNNITEDWFRCYVSELEKYGGEYRDYVNCDVRLGSDFENRVAFRNRQTWTDYVMEHWIDVAETSIWQKLSACPAECVVRQGVCNHRRHDVFLTLVAGNVSDIERTFELLCQTLSLTVSHPYRYRRSSLEFEIGNWRPDLFVVGIKSIAALLGPDPDLPEAYGKSFEGDIEKLTPFLNLKSFCESVGMRASRFEEVAIRMQARSMGVGVGVTSDHKKLRIRTSLPPDKVDPLIAAWPDELKLKPVKATDTGADVGGIAPTPSENPWLKYAVPVVVAFATAVSTAGAISLKKAIFPDYKVIITSPLVHNGVATWSGNIISFDWYLQPDQSSFRAIKKDVAATVKVHSSSGSQHPLESKPPVTVPLEPGSYLVVVDAPGAAPAQFQLVVDKRRSELDQPRP